MYSTILMVHSWMRWVAIVAGIGAVFAALRARTDDRGADLWGLVFMTTLDIQLLLGLLL